MPSLSRRKRSNWIEKKKSDYTPASALNRSQHSFLQSHAALTTQLNHLRSQLSTAKTHLMISESLLAHLESTNVYNDAFNIGHVALSGSTDQEKILVGTINGLRLGGRPVVEWDEINAAWGLVALCIERIAAKVDYTFEQ